MLFIEVPWYYQIQSLANNQKCKKKSHISVLKITPTQNAFPSPRVHSNSHHIVLCIMSHSKYSHWSEHGLWQHGCNSSAQLAPEHQCYDTAVSPHSRPAVPCRPIWLVCPEDTLMNLNQLPATAQDSSSQPEIIMQMKPVNCYREHGYGRVTINLYRQ